MSAKIIALPNCATGDHSNSNAVQNEMEMAGELRRARIRIAQLEANLTEAMRDSLMNFNRARDAERRLEDLRGY